jgi:hypothetical protein
VSGTARGGRRALALPEPPGGAPLPRAEARTLRGPWYRAHHPDNGAWYFESSDVNGADGGRFDLPQPHGTGYLASTPEVALRERLGIVAAGRPLTAAAVAASAVSVMTLTANHHRNIADTIHPDAADSITREIATTTDYARTRRWAAHWHDAEHRTGVRYEPRFSTGPSSSLALFGPAGPADHGTRLLTSDEWVAPRGVAEISRRAAEVIDE